MSDAPSWYTPPSGGASAPAGGAPSWYKPPGATPLAAPPAAPAESGLMSAGKSYLDLLFAPYEAGKSMLSGAVAKPVSDVAGLAAVGKEMVSPTPGGGDPAGFRASVQQGLTHQPPTKVGQDIAKYNPLSLLGLGIDKVAGAANRAAAPPGSGMGRQALGNAAEEALKQAPGFIGARGGAATNAAGGALRGAAERTMQSALKPPLGSLEKGNAGRAVGTMLDEGINVSKGGLGKLNTKIDGLNDQIDTLVANSKGVVDKRAVAANLHETLDKFEKQVTPMSDVAAIQRAWDEFLTYPHSAKNDPMMMSVQTAQELKRGTYRSLRDRAYGELKSADLESQKALARGLKDEIAKAIPEVRPLNAEESKLLNTLPLVERRVLMEANKNPIGLGILSLNPGHLAAWMADRSSAFKSIVARMLNQGAEATREGGPVAGVALSQSAAGTIPPPPKKRRQDPVGEP